MNKYLIGVVLHPKLDDEAIKTEHDTILELVARFGGVVDKIDNWGRKKLAYEINKLHEGFYCFINVSADASFPAELESRLRIRENIIRFLITKDEIVPVAQVAPVAKPVEATVEAEVEAEIVDSEPTEAPSEEVQE